MFDTLHFRQRYGRTTFYTTVILYLSYLLCLTAYTSIMGEAYSALFEEHNLTSCQNSIFSQSNSSKSKFGFHTVPDNFTVKAGILIVVYGDQPAFCLFSSESVALQICMCYPGDIAEKRERVLRCLVTRNCSSNHLGMRRWKSQPWRAQKHTGCH